MTMLQDKENAKKEKAIQNAQGAGAQNVSVMMNSILDSEKMRTRFDELLGKRAPQFISALITMVNADVNLQAAFYESPMTVIQSALKAAAFDLPIDQSLGYAYIVPFKNSKKDADGSWTRRSEATFVLGWKGMNQLALRTGAYSKINVVDVREGELVSYDRLTEDIEFSWIEDEDKRDELPVIGYVGYYRLVNGASKTIYKTVNQIKAHEKRFRKGEYQSKGWKDNFDDMARKTMYRMLIGKYGIMSIDYQTPAEGVETANVLRSEFADDVETPAPINAEFTDAAEETEEAKG